MAVGQGFVQADRGIYFGLQSAKGSAASTLKGAISFTKFTTTPQKDVVKGVPMLGRGNYMQQSVGAGFKVDFQAEGWVSLSLFPAFFLALVATKTTTGSSAPYSHAFALLAKAVLMKYATILVVYGESSMGSGVQTEMIRDCRIKSFSFKIVGGDAIKFTFSGSGLNEGPGAASPTLSFDSGIIFPVAVSSANTYTHPSWFPTAANICVTELDIAWDANAVDGPVCINGTGERSDIFLPEAGWTLTHKFLYTTDMVVVYNWINYNTDTPSADTSQLSTAIQTGAFSVQLLANEIITGATHYSMTVSIPSGQWTTAQVDNETPNILTVAHNSYGSDAAITIVNNTSGTNFAI